MCKKQSYYMCFVEGGKAPQYKHRTIHSAENEALRLMRLLSRDVSIVKIHKIIKPKSDFEVVNFDDDGLPF